MHPLHVKISSINMGWTEYRPPLVIGDGTQLHVTTKTGAQLHVTKEAVTQPHVAI